MECGLDRIKLGYAKISSHVTDFCNSRRIECGQVAGKLQLSYHVQMVEVKIKA
jgi:hypothetical protein